MHVACVEQMPLRVIDLIDKWRSSDRWNRLQQDHHTCNMMHGSDAAEEDYHHDRECDAPECETCDTLRNLPHLRANLKASLEELQEIEELLIEHAPSLAKVEWPLLESILKRQIATPDVAMQMQRIYFALKFGNKKSAPVGDTPVPPKNLPRGEIIWRGGFVYGIGDHPSLSVTLRENLVLQAFLKNNGVLCLKALISASKCEDARKVLNGLRNRYDARFAPAITMAQKRDNGGYRVEIAGAQIVQGNSPVLLVSGS